VGARIISCLIVTLGLTCPALAGEFYNASAPRTYPGDSLSYFYNPGPANGGQPGHIVFDDVTVASPFPATLFNVTKVTYKLSQKSMAPGMLVFPYYARLYPQGVNQDYLPQAPVQFATAGSIPTNLSASSIEQEIHFGDGLHTLFNVPGATASADTQYKSFGIGLRLSTTGSDNGWTVADHLENMDLLWDYKDDTHVATFTYAFGTDTVIPGTQYVKVEGLVLSGVPGDATINGKVDIDDLLRLATHWQQNGDYTMGDFNFDGVVNNADLAILAAHWQDGVASLSESAASLGISSAPEPSGTAALVMLCGLVARRRRID
jgi:MYXO-CTERM domain-containing protein